MASYVARRLLGAVPLVLGIATIIFFVVNLAPGDPTALYFNRNVPPEVLDQIRQNFGLDQPLHIRYWKWLTAFLTGDFGYSYQHSRPVVDIVLETLPATLMLAGSTLVLIFLIGVATGVFQAVRQHRTADRVLSVVSLFFYSMPSFWLGLMLMLLFSLKAHEWGLPFALPPTGMTSPVYEFLPFWQQVVDRLAHLVLPVLTLTLVMAAGIARYTRGQMLEVIRQDYIRTARAKGLPERTVVFKHALRNSLLPVITLLGLYLPLLFSGSVFVEVIFSWPGMGRVIVDAIFQRDYPLVMATSFIFALVVVIGSLVADVLYAVADPRIRYE
ncbi:MAG: ABC transporter permease subunit [Gemmatimonadetes bacterium]|nr:ABC transporter permease [Gemmatimonadota bacterium]NIQ54136.1 ABC transporter permease [Gemmatimonadota bacterium]NIU74335.1 ABC transporter permease subunit [Gammaproteobacteria bacterium]NIX44344.1 ABC transporter permease subunit [Gemmatimonadota bacterium]NIY08560.1 ABC transporter permease subunit [Gemmatimonadota bacterium]